MLHALRYTGDEVQLGRVLAALCQDPAVARAFVQAVLAAAQGGARAAVDRLTPVPEGVTCVDEHVLRVRTGRAVLRERYRDAGRVDLDFRAPSGWRVLVELKLGHKFGDRQLERYALEHPVAAVVRDIAAVPEQIAQSPNWLGATTWVEIAAHLHDLPIEGIVRDHWRGLLEVVEEDGDFLGARTTPREVEEAHALLAGVADEAVRELRDQLAQRYGVEATTLAEQLRARRPGPGLGPWAGFGIRSDEGDWIWIAIRNLWTRAPRLRIWFYDYTDTWAKHKGKAAYRSIEQEHDFEPRLSGGWRWENPVPRLSGGDAAALRQEIADRLSALVGAGVFDVAIRRARR